MLTVNNKNNCNPDIWGGAECTINRVNDNFRDQLAYAGHYTRATDIDGFASLGIKAMRFPILWEKHQPAADALIDWTYTAARVEQLKSKGITIIAGLLHHGSGPAFTSLYDKNFPEKFAAYAKLVAGKFPSLQYYTPVNEPLTTARFSGLYGLWYPHHSNDHSFARILLNQLKGTVLAMQEIRKINRDAVLVQTEDLCEIHSTPALQYQANFENERRWLTYDILCGRLNEAHAMWPYFIEAGIDKKELQFFLDNPCPPCIAGFNYYVTSERWLDERTELYPGCSDAGNGIHRYTDTAAVHRGKRTGLKALLKKAWNKYGIPIALTEVHLCCTREEQLRWFKNAWDDCVLLKKEGVNVCAITAWALLGAYDWNSLLTKAAMHYEPGVFDLSNTKPRETALAKMIRQLSSSGNYEHPLLQQDGWWETRKKNTMETAKGENRPILIAGAAGTLGTAFEKICHSRSIPVIALAHADLDICNSDQVAHMINYHKPWAIINTAGFVDVEKAEINIADCFRYNTIGPQVIAQACQAHGIKFMTFSSDLVFNGEQNIPYSEADEIGPLNIYGRSKAEGEAKVAAACPGALIIRTSAFFGPWDDYNFAADIIRTLEQGKVFAAANDVTVSPTYVPDLVNAALDLFIDDETGTWHISNEGGMTWYEFAGRVAAAAGYNPRWIEPRLQSEMNWKARRPQYSVLQSSRGIKLPPLDHALNRFFNEKKLIQYAGD